MSYDEKMVAVQERQRRLTGELVSVRQADHEALHGADGRRGLDHRHGLRHPAFAAQSASLPTGVCVSR